MILRALNMLKPYDLDFYQTEVKSATLSSVSETSPGVWRLTFSAATTGIFPGMYIYVGSGPNEGYYLIDAVDPSNLYVNVSGTLTAQVSAWGTVTIYDVKTSLFNPLVSYWKSYVEKITGLSFSGEQDIEEVHDGTGYEELMLDRRPVKELKAIQLLNMPNTVLSIPVSSVEVIQDQGILRVRAINLEAYTFMSPIWPKGRNNIKVTYSAGYDDYPEDIANALAMLITQGALGTQAGLSGGGASLSVVAWSKSYGARGKYSEIRNDLAYQAMAILKKYSSGVVG